jgi:hypothetical protein
MLLRRSHVIAAQPPAARHTLQAIPRLPAVCVGSRPNTHFLHTRTRDRAHAQTDARARARTHTHTHTLRAHTHTHTFKLSNTLSLASSLPMNPPPEHPSQRGSPANRLSGDRAARNWTACITMGGGAGYGGRDGGWWNTGAMPEAALETADVTVGGRVKSACGGGGGGGGGSMAAQRRGSRS